MTNSQTQNFIKDNIQTVINSFYNNSKNIPKNKKIKLYFPSTKYQNDKIINKFKNKYQIKWQYDFNQFSATTFFDGSIAFHINILKNYDKKRIASTICHELWHVFQPYCNNKQNYFNNSHYHWILKNYFCREYKGLHPFIQNFQNNKDELFATLFEEAAVYDFFYGHQIIQNEFKCNTKNIYNDIKHLYL